MRGEQEDASVPLSDAMAGDDGRKLWAALGLLVVVVVRDSSGRTRLL